MNPFDALLAAFRLIRKGAQAQAYIMAGVTARLKGSLGAEKNKEDYKCSVN
jgi:hypothetical protein